MPDRYESMRAELDRARLETIRATVRAELAERRPVHWRIPDGGPDRLAATGVSADRPDPMEAMHMSTNVTQRSWARPFLLAAACVVLVSGGIIALVAVTADDAEPVDVGSSGRPATVPTASPTTIAPTAVEGVETTSSPTISSVATTPPAATDPAVDGDQALVESMMLTSEEYGPGFVQNIPTLESDFGFDPTVAARLPECASFVDTVFAPIDHAAHADVIFTMVNPEVAMPQFSVLLPTPEAARTIFLTLNSPDFAPCSVAYANALAGGNCCESAPRLPSALHEPLTEPPPLERSTTVAYRRIADTSGNLAGQQHEAGTVLDAVVLHDRSITFIQSIELTSGTVRRGPAALSETLGNVVEHAERATGVAAPEWAERQLQRADGMRLTSDDLGVEWLPSYARAGDNVFEPSLAVGTICEPLLQTFASMSGSLRASRWFQTTGDDPVVLHQQTVRASADTFRALLTPEFNACAQVHDGVFPVLRLPVPAVEEIDASTSAAFYEYESDDGIRHVAALVASWDTVSLLDLSGPAASKAMLQTIIDALAPRVFESSF